MPGSKNVEYLKWWPIFVYGTQTKPKGKSLKPLFSWNHLAWVPTNEKYNFACVCLWIDGKFFTYTTITFQNEVKKYDENR